MKYTYSINAPSIRDMSKIEIIKLDNKIMNINKQYRNLVEKVIVYRLWMEGSCKFYIGSTSRWNERQKEHIRQLKGNRHNNIYLQEHYNSLNFPKISFEVLYVGTDGRDVEDFILQNIDFKYYFNISKSAVCGDTIYNHPNRQKILKEKSEKSKGSKNNNWRGGASTTSCKHCGKEIRTIKGRQAECKPCYFINRDITGENNPFYGKKHTEELKKKFSERMKGKIITETQEVSINGIIYSSISEASRQTGIHKDTINHRCKSKNILYKDFYKIKDGVKKDLVKRKTNSKYFGRISVEGVIFNSLREVSSKYEMSPSVVLNRLKSINFKDWYINE